MQKLLSRHQGKLSHGTIPEQWQITIAKGERRTLNEYVWIDTKYTIETEGHHSDFLVTLLEPQKIVFLKSKAAL